MRFRRRFPKPPAGVLALLERGVWVQPGYFFGFPNSGWLVVSLLGSEGEFSTGVTSLITFLGINH